MTNEELRAQIEALQTENANLKRSRTNLSGTLTLKVGQKGGVVIYGTGRFPVTLYPSQAVTFFNGCKGGIADRVRAFVVENQSTLTFKDDTKEDILSACVTTEDE